MLKGVVEGSRKFRLKEELGNFSGWYLYKEYKDMFFFLIQGFGNFLFCYVGMQCLVQVVDVEYEGEQG